MVDVSVNHLAIAFFWDKDRPNSHSGKIEKESEFHMTQLIVFKAYFHPALVFRDKLSLTMNNSLG